VHRERDKEIPDARAVEPTKGKEKNNRGEGSSLQPKAMEDMDEPDWIIDCGSKLRRRKRTLLKGKKKSKRRGGNILEKNAPRWGKKIPAGGNAGLKNPLLRWGKKKHSVFWMAAPDTGLGTAEREVIPHERQEPTGGRL